MIVTLYSVHDTVAGYYMPIFSARNDGEASRMFVQSMGEAFSHRADYNLYRVAQFDVEEGLVESMTPQIVLRGTSIPADQSRLDPEE